MTISLGLQRGDRLFEVENFPESDPEIQKPDAAHCATDPTRSNNGLNFVNAGLARRVEQEVVVTPIADPPHAVRPPWSNSEKGADFKTQEDIKNDAELCQHNAACELSESHSPDSNSQSSLLLLSQLA